MVLSVRSGGRLLPVDAGRKLRSFARETGKCGKTGASHIKPSRLRSRSGCGSTKPIQHRLMSTTSSPAHPGCSVPTRSRLLRPTSMQCRSARDRAGSLNRRHRLYVQLPAPSVGRSLSVPVPSQAPTRPPATFPKVPHWRPGRPADVPFDLIVGAFWQE